MCLLPIINCQLFVIIVHNQTVTTYNVELNAMQVLQKKFEEFKRDVAAGADRYSSANKFARQLVAEGHSDTVMIKEKQDQMRFR